MRSSEQFTPSLPNAFSSSFLHRVAELDEPFTAGEADAAGPWRVVELPGRGFGLFRHGESTARGHRPTALFRQRWLALLAAAVLPGTGRDAAFRLEKDSGPEGFAVETGNGGEPMGFLELFDERLIEALHVAEGLLRSPEALALLLEAAGQVALERAGAILDERIPA
ncbi:MAG TPA: hypothetical protein VIE43_05555 [Thermoanaerobaculia bacterium]|jgi:hypothetical protein|nr:hypothetical protein [Thermoanaerobaculia bacterium]